MDQSGKDRIYYPMIVSNDGTSAPLSKEEDALLWKKYLTLSQKERDIITAHEVPGKLQELQEKFGLEEGSIGQLSLCIRKIFFKELDLVECEKKVLELLKKTDAEAQDTAKKIIEFIDKEILHLEPKIVPEEIYAETPAVPATVKLPLLKAMSDYKHVADQLITSEKIKLRNSTELVRPTLSNWIRSYREELGIGFHEPVKRGGFLFQSQNGKKLTNDDRAKLNLILKSIEEGFPLDIDPKREAIIFPAGSDASMELTQVNTNARPVANRFIQPRAMPVGTVRPAAFAPGMAPAPAIRPSGVMLPKPTPATPVLANLKPLFSKTTPPEKNISGETLHFSTGHVLPAEKASEKTVPPVAPMVPPAPVNQSVQHPSQGIKREPGASLPKSPYTIRPLRLRNDDRPSA